MAAKRRKVDIECRSFQASWTLDYFSKEHSGKSICLICHDFVSVNKDYHIKRHYETKHAEFMKLSRQARRDKAFQLAKSLQQQFSFFTKKRGEIERNT